ncbi:methyltransferase domain-containing protein [Pseudonocardia sp. HH130630-07]|uniref:methyltransferase domain-containing protein n=1 Tax=Pseudonocardia sp. HH130630-07 TaxID=1690815 RepID=UPI00081520C9|nr:methyltransferase domain-containing protein [Pseudonocardia sp. HH130630-07]ANY07787.1 hypothetical protein AFB00_17465 [Pseudonocardia sp. HH130630-07]
MNDATNDGAAATDHDDRADGHTGRHDGVDTDAWREHAARMAAALSEQGRVRDPRWLRLLAEFPRQWFVPGVPLARVYTDAVVTQTRTADDGTGRELATSSLSAPAAVGVALEALELQGGERVLEIGTGTGYVAGLLSSRLGADRVASVDIDPDLVASARARLGAVGLHPTLHAGDGHAGLAEHAPYDRILATCSITHVPPAWIHQLAMGGRIVAPLDGDLDSPVVVLDKTADDEVVGRFLLDGGGFMPLRAIMESPLGAGDDRDATATRTVPSHSTSALDPARLATGNAPLALFCHLHLPGLHKLSRHDGANQPAELILRHRESTATVALAPGDDGRWPVTQTGPRRIWDTIETAVALWDHLAEPAPTRFGISALDLPHRQYAWLDDPDGPYCWPLPTQ